VQALITLTTIANDVKKDSKTALAYIDRILEIDPANEFATKAKPILKKLPTGLHSKKAAAAQKAALPNKALSNKALKLGNSD
jgi:hypothetical protein